MIDVVKTQTLREQYTPDTIGGMFIELITAWNESSFRDFFQKTCSALEKIHQVHFDSESDPLGRKWPEWYFRRWSTPTVHKTLQVSGKLMRSVTGRGEGHYQDVEDRFLVWGSVLPYAGIHQFGATFTLGVTLFGKKGEVAPAGHKITIPPRPFVGLNDDQLTELANDVADQMIEFLKYKG